MNGKSVAKKLLLDSDFLYSQMDFLIAIVGNASLTGIVTAGSTVLKKPGSGHSIGRNQLT
jgi:hypothetical protein